MSLLEVENLVAGYGRVPVLHDVTLTVQPGEVVAVLGRNGVGKTTLLRTIAGVGTDVMAGRVRLAGTDALKLSAHQRARLGISFVPEDRGIFGSLSVVDNLRLGLLAGSGRRTLKYALDLFPLLAERLAQPAGSLSGGERQMLALARALLTEPKLLLLDEFSEGLQPNVVHELANRLIELAQTGVAALLVEQNPALALRIGRRVYVLQRGEVVDSGPSSAFSSDEARLRQHLVI